MRGMKQLHIFRQGLHRDMWGQTIAFSQSDLAATVAAYNPALSEAPIVIGHPHTDDPSYGWVEALHAGPDGLKATTRQVNPAFAELVERGAYKKISASFYAPDAPNNPVKGVYYLKHVGVLGAVPPAVKGLQPISFSEQEEGIVEFSESDLAEGQQLDAILWRNFRDWLIAQYGLEAADKVVQTWHLDALNARARDAASDAPANDAAIEALKDETEAKAEEQTPQADTAAFAERPADSEAAQLRAELARLKAQQHAQAQRATHAANVAFAEGLVAKGMKPVHVDAVVAALDVAAGDSVAFAEGQSPLADSLKTLFEGLAGSVSFAEQATVKRAADVHTNPLLADALARGKRS